MMGSALMMKRVIVLLVIVLTLASVQAQDERNGAWTRLETDTVRFAIPADWVRLDASTVTDAGEDTVLSFDDTCPVPADATLAEWVDRAAENTGAADITRASLGLPLGEAIRLEWETEAGAWNAALYALAADACLVVRATASEPAPIFERILHTISWVETEAEGGWLLQADSTAAVTLRTPPNWRKLPAQNSLMVRETFDDVLVQVQYRDLGGTTDVAALQPQFDALYAERDFVIADVQVLNLPVGDVLLYRLESVELGVTAPQTQFQAAIMRGNYLILATFGADERYFAEYEETLLRILDTLTFHVDRIP